MTKEKKRKYRGRKTIHPKHRLHLVFSLSKQIYRHSAAFPAPIHFVSLSVCYLAFYPLKILAVSAVSNG